MGGIDIFIANAGFAYYEQLDEADWDHIASIYQTNVFSPFYAAVRMGELNRTTPIRSSLPPPAWRSGESPATRSTPAPKAR